jgi:hypothetical protein
MHVVVVRLTGSRAEILVQAFFSRLLRVFTSAHLPQTRFIEPTDRLLQDGGHRG